MDFEEYMATTGMDEQTENSCAWKFYKELYRAGQQSKQAEIDELQKRINDALKEIESGITGKHHAKSIIKILKGELK